MARDQGHFARDLLASGFGTRCFEQKVDLPVGLYEGQGVHLEAEEIPNVDKSIVVLRSGHLASLSEPK